MTAGGGEPRRPPIPAGPALVCGLARSGQSVARLLAGAGVEVVAVDSAAPEGAAGLAADGVEVHLDAAGEDLLERVSVLVKSPGVPASAPAVAAARSKGLPVLSELEVGWRATSSPAVAVTGTNGKTTVVEMVGHVMREVGRRTHVVGNVGRPISDVAADDGGDGQLVVEASSFQLEDCDGFAPEVAVLLNLSEDHLDRHSTMCEYRAAKMRIFERQRESDYAVVPAEGGFDDLQGAAARLTFGEGEADALVVDGAILWRGGRVVGAGELPLPGRHNLLNAAAATAACVAAGVDPLAVGQALSGFPGVAHRLELVAVIGGVRWVNDSKATNVASALTAIAAVEGPVRIILGGISKGQDFSPLAEEIERVGAAVHLIGEAAAELEPLLRGAASELHRDGTLEAAVASCAEAARAGETVLLAPACASFDQFTDFVERGERFRDLAMGLAA